MGDGHEGDAPQGESAASALGELHILNGLNQRKYQMTNNRQMLGGGLRRKRERLMTGEIALQQGMTNYAVTTPWLDDTWTRRGGDAAGMPKFVGASANELSKWMNAESITRHREELNRECPTLRQVMKVDDGINMKQLTKSQGSTQGDGSKHHGHLDRTAKLRHMQSYRAVCGKD